MAEFCSYSGNHMAYKAYNLYSLALCKKKFADPSSRKMDCVRNTWGAFKNYRSLGLITSLKEAWKAVYKNALF